MQQQLRVPVGECRNTAPLTVVSVVSVFSRPEGVKPVTVGVVSIVPVYILNKLYHIGNFFKLI